MLARVPVGEPRGDAGGVLEGPLAVAEEPTSPTIGSAWIDPQGWGREKMLALHAAYSGTMGAEAR